MLRKLSLALVASALIATPAVAASSTGKTLSTTGTVQGALVGAVNGQPTIAGYVKDSKRGIGAVIFTNVSVGTRKTTPFTVYFAGGSLGGTALFDSAANPDGTIAITNGTLRFTKSTGTLKGSTGTGTVQGSSNGMSAFMLTYTSKLTQKVSKGS